MASGDTLARFLPPQGSQPVSNPATLDTRQAAIPHFVWDFDAATNESIVFPDIMPQNYAGTTGVTVYIHYAMSSAVANTVDWDAAFELIGDQQQDLDADGFAAVNSVDDTTVPGTAGLVDIVSIPFTDGADMDSIGPGDGYRLKITRDAVSDDAAGDAEIWAVEIRET